jgi:uncharacterized protein YbjT (DUF2867 family)
MSLRVTVVGGTGFIGRHLTARLAARGALVRIVSRRTGPPRAPSLQIEHVAGTIEDASIIERAVDGATAVVNLVGTTSAKREQEFYALHCDMPRRLAEAALRAGVRRFVFASAMGVALDAPSAADRSKAAGENAVRDAFPDANIVRPALVYGPGDHFFTMFAGLVRSAPAIPLIGGGHTRFQPMHVDDAAEAMARIIEDPGTARRAFELGAGEVFTFREMLERLCRAIGRRPWLVPVPFPLAQAAALLTQWLPNAPLTLDQVRLLRTDKIIRDVRSGPAALGIRPRLLEDYLSELRNQ